LKSQIRWGRVLAAAFLSEISVIAGLLAIIGVYTFLIASGKSAADQQEFSQQAAYYFTPWAAGVATFLWAIWAVRGLTARIVANASLVGLAAFLLTAGFIFTARPEDRLMYVVSFVLRLIAGYAAGMLAQARSKHRPLSSAARGKAASK